MNFSQCFDIHLKENTPAEKGELALKADSFSSPGYIAKRHVKEAIKSLDAALLKFEDADDDEAFKELAAIIANLNKLLRNP